VDYYRRSAERLPDRADPYRSLGGLQLATGEHDRARESYERALLVDPDDVEVLVALAELDRAIGDWQAAQHHAASALEAARTQQGRLVAFREMRRYHEYRRDQTGVLAHQERMTEAARESLPPVSVAMMEILGLGDYVRAGRAEEARARLDRLSGTLPAVVDAFAGPLGRLEVWLALEEPDSIGASADAAKRAIERSGLETLAPRVLHARARMHELREEWPAALEDYRREQELTPSDVTLGADLARIHRQLGDLERAEALLLETLAVWPSHGAANLQLGKVYLAAGRPEDAIRHLERALDTWAIGDPADAQVADARATLDDARLRLRAVRSRG
jgi:tetratricopeptide (TPR) repeat protein